MTSHSRSFITDVIRPHAIPLWYHSQPISRLADTGVVQRQGLENTFPHDVLEAIVSYRLQSIAQNAERCVGVYRRRVRQKDWVMMHETFKIFY